MRPRERSKSFIQDKEWALAQGSVGLWGRVHSMLRGLGSGAEMQWGGPKWGLVARPSRYESLWASGLIVLH